MKKQIYFYISWVALFTVFLFSYCNAKTGLDNLYFKGGNVYPILLLQIVLPLIVGGFIFWLVIISTRYPLTKQRAVLELVIVGGSSFCFSTSLLFAAFATRLMGAAVPAILSIWSSNNIAPTIGSVLLGYELCIFLFRMSKIKKIT